MRRIMLLVMMLCIALCNSFSKAIPTQNPVNDEVVNFAAAFLEQLRSNDNNTQTINELKIVYVGYDEGTPRYYVLNHEHGYIIVSAGSNQQVLGYGDEPLDMTAAPQAMTNWLDGYAEQLSYAEQTGIAPRRTAARRSNVRRASIPPLVTSTWGQGEPYSTACPVRAGGYYATGCVATAMAQAMRANPDHPTRGTGTVSYTATVGSETPTISVNFANVTFDWSLMPDALTSSSPAAEIAEVAKLMYHCGIAVETKYKANESTASSLRIPRALMTNFGYDKTVHHLKRDFFTPNRWTKMLYDELAAGRPVIYNGNSSSAGHSFVIDGYEATPTDEYFHINWGWEGSCNGYFLLDALSPDRLGVGGGTTLDGYNTNQGAVFGMVANQSNASKYIIGIDGGMNTPLEAALKDATTRINFLASTSSYPLYQTSGAASFRPLLGYNIVDVATNDTTFMQTGSITLLLGGSYGIQQFFITPATLTNGRSDGTYHISPAFRPNASSPVNPIMSYASMPKHIVMTISGDSVRFENGELEADITDEPIPEITEFALADGQPYDNPYDIEHVDIEYTREFKKTTWQPFYVPFSLDYEEWADWADVAELGGVHMYADGHMIIEFLTVTEGKTLPNTPYVIKPKEAGVVNGTFMDKLLKATPGEKQFFISCSSPRWTYKIYGNYQAMTGIEMDELYTDEYGGRPYISSNGTFAHLSATAKLSSGRIILVRERNPNGYWGAPMRGIQEKDDYMYLSVDGIMQSPEDVDGIFGPTAEDDTANGECYDLQGRRVEKLQRGIYVCDGKKILVK